MPDQSFPKIERLKSRKLISALFRTGTSVYQSPIRAIYLKVSQTESPPEMKVTFSVPKRNFPKAHERNLLKRRMREAYRLHRHEYFDQLWLTKSTVGLSVIFLYYLPEIKHFGDIEKSMKQLLRKMASDLQAGK